MSKSPTFSIIIPCFNAELYIRNCLISILKSSFSNYEIIVVDDGSTDNSAKLINSLANSKTIIKLISLTKNIGPARARNLGVSKAKGKYLVFLDADTEIEKNCLQAIATMFSKNPKIGALQTKLVKGKSNQIESLGHFLSPFGFPYEVGTENNRKENQKKMPIFAARSAGMAIKKDLFQKIGGFDEDYFIYGEETDLCWRVRLSGSKIYYLPKAKVHHFQKSTLNKKTNFRIFYEGAKNNTSNILKNAPFKTLVWMLPLHFLGWIFLSLKLILQKRVNLAGWIYKGLWWNLKNLNKTLKKRKRVAFFTIKDNQCSKIIFGKISPKMLLLKSWQWFYHV